MNPTRKLAGLLSRRSHTSIYAECTTVPRRHPNGQSLQAHCNQIQNWLPIASAHNYTGSITRPPFRVLQLFPINGQHLTRQNLYRIILFGHC